MRISDWSSDVCSSDLVDDGGLPEQAFDGRQWRLGAHQRALAFQAFQQRGFFAADIRAGGATDLEIEAAAAAAYVGAQPTGLDRKSVVGGKRVTVRLSLGGCRISKKHKESYYES